jgi:hypothetical protein
MSISRVSANWAKFWAHPDKLASLEHYIDELQQKKEDGQEALASLTQLASLHTNALTGILAQIQTIQNNIEVAYVDRDGDKIMSNLQDLEEYHIDEQEHRNTALFATRMAKEYAVLIAAAEQKLTVLRANTAALAQWITVTLPAGVNIKALKDLRIFATGTQ